MFIKIGYVLYIKYSLNIFKIYTCMCIYIYIYTHNKYTQNTHILCKQKLLLFFYMINRSTKLNIIYVFNPILLFLLMTFDDSLQT